MTDTFHASEGSPGYQGSETSSAELIIYPQPPDDVLQRRNPTQANQLIEFRGRSERRVGGFNPVLVQLGTNKPLQGTGSWQATIKAEERPGMSFRDLIADDAWVDIIFSRFGKRTHTMRGLVHQIGESKRTSGSGATVTNYTLTGFDFQSIWERTPIWFNKYADPANAPENVVGAAALQVAQSLTGGNLDVSQFVQLYLKGFLEAVGAVGRANWLLPQDMPGVGNSDPSFIGNVLFNDNDFTDDPPRIAINPQLLDPNGANAWPMAQAWSDPAFVEMWADLLPGGDPIADVADQVLPDETVMTVVIRDRPFPTLDLGRNSPYFSLKTIELFPQEITNQDLARGGMERFNAFFVSPQITQDLVGTSALEITAPLWSGDDMLVHGFRRFDIDTKYRSLDGDLLAITKAQRQKIRDWYSMNPYLYSGTMELGRPELKARVGMRVRRNERDENDNLTAYIENVAHNWSLGSGVKTTLGVTRGWFGTDDDYLGALSRVVTQYANSNRQDNFAEGQSTGIA